MFKSRQHSTCMFQATVILMQTFKYFSLGLLALFFTGCNSYATPVKTGEKIMSELTKTMQPVCVGRFIIEIPTVANIHKWSHESDYIKVESISPPSVNQKTFEAKVRKLEAKLKTSPHDTDIVLLKNKIQLAQNNILFVYREKKDVKTRYKLEALFWQPDIEYLFSVDTTNKYLDKTIEDITKLTKSFIALPTKAVISGPSGFCVEHGVITLKETRFESIEVIGRIAEYPGLEFKFSTQSTNDKFDDKTLIERLSGSFNMGNALSAFMTESTTFLRKGKRKLNGQQGEEVVVSFKTNDKKSMDASAEFYGEPHTLEKPLIEIELTYDQKTDEPPQPNKKTLSEKDFLALWDALLNGIKPRTSSLWGNGSIKK